MEPVFNPVGRDQPPMTRIRTSSASKKVEIGKWSVDVGGEQGARPEVAGISARAFRADPLNLKEQSMVALNWKGRGRRGTEEEEELLKWPRYEWPNEAP